MAIAYNENLNNFLCQGIEEKSNFEETQDTLISMFK
jgi:flagellum-specific ATP synthase